MTQAVFHGSDGAANHRSDKCSDDFSWREFFEQLFPEDTAAWVASFTRTKVRAAEHVLSGRNGVSGRALINLLRSPRGRQVLDAICGDAEWRANELRLIRLADLEQQLEEQKRSLASLRQQLDGARK